MNKFIKFTEGTVRQIFKKQDNGKFVCVYQQFMASDMVSYTCDDSICENFIPPDYEYEPFTMASPVNTHNISPAKKSDNGLTDAEKKDYDRLNLWP